TDPREMKITPNSSPNGISPRKTHQSTTSTKPAPAPCAVSERQEPRSRFRKDALLAPSPSRRGLGWPDENDAFSRITFIHDLLRNREAPSYPLSLRERVGVRG